MNRTIRLIEAIGGQYLSIGRQLYLPNNAYHKLQNKKIGIVDKVILNSVYPTVNLSQHPTFPRARLLTLNDCNKFFVSDLISNLRQHYPRLETAVTNTKGFGDIDLLKSPNPHLTRIYFGDKNTWESLPDIAKVFKLKNFAMSEDKKIAWYFISGQFRHLEYINPSHWNANIKKPILLTV